MPPWQGKKLSLTPSWHCHPSPTADGSEIRIKPVEVGSVHHYLQGFSTIPGGDRWIFVLSTVWFRDVTTVVFQDWNWTICSSVCYHFEHHNCWILFLSIGLSWWCAIETCTKALDLWTYLTYLTYLARSRVSTWNSKSECRFQNSEQFSPRWWFHIVFIFIPIWGRFQFWPMFFRWVETTNQSLGFITWSDLWVFFCWVITCPRKFSNINLDDAPELASWHAQHWNEVINGENLGIQISNHPNHGNQISLERFQSNFKALERFQTTQISKHWKGFNQISRLETKKHF